MIGRTDRPFTVTGADHAGVRFAYLRDTQDGTLVELIQPPVPGADG
ncbi:hypothetical protein ACFWMG_15235 [Streptomyces sp. NPDC127074]